MAVATKTPDPKRGKTRAKIVGKLPAWSGRGAQRSPGMGPQWFRVGPQMSQDGPSQGKNGANMEPGWPTDGPKMAHVCPRVANSKAGRAKSRGSARCSKRYPFLTVSVPRAAKKSYDEAKMQPKWRRSDARWGQEATSQRPRWCQDESKSERRWPQGGPREAKVCEQEGWQQMQ